MTPAVQARNPMEERQRKKRKLKLDPDEPGLIVEEKQPEHNEKEDNASDEEVVEEKGGEGTGFGRAFLQILGKEAVVESGEAPILVKAHRAAVAAAEAERAQLVGQQEAKKQRKELVELAHVLPTPGPTPKERALLQIATKGVVRLFNAVAKAQKDQLEGAQKADGRHKVKGGGLDKRSFLAELRGVAGGAEPAQAGADRIGAGSDEPRGEGAANAQHSQQAEVAEGGAGQASWDVLRDDFMLRRHKATDFDKETEEPVLPTSFEDSGSEGSSEGDGNGESEEGSDLDEDDISDEG